MACLWTKLPDGTVVQINLCRGRRKKCGFCSRRDATLLCDSPIGKKTCAAAMCDKCSTRIGRDMDYCPRCEAERKAAVARAERAR